MKILKKLKTEYILLFFILAFSAFFRLYSLDKLLGFWYDQGRDALVIWDLLHYGRFFLIGPVTGIDGIYLGPFYYYLLAPFYWLGKGNPVMPAGALALSNVGAGFLLYYLGKKVFHPAVGLIAAFLWGFSYNLVTFSRWLANPTPLPFFALLTVLFLYKFITGKVNNLIYACFVLGLCLQLEAASAIFFIPSILLIMVWQRKKLNFKLIFLSLFWFFITLLPQIVFNFHHDGILVLAFKKFLIEEKSFKLSLWVTIQKRLLLYYDVFIGKLIPSGTNLKLAVLALFSACILYFRKNLFSKEKKLLLIWILVPLLGYFFYQGNHGYVWDYYFSGIVPVFFLIFSAGIYFFFKKHIIGKIVVWVFLIFFTIINVRLTKNYLKTGIGIKIEAQKLAIDWIYKDAGQESFNTDFYVPPQIYYSYSYLMKWYGNEKYGREPDTKLVKNLYTLYEPDGEHPQFLKAWLNRQDTIGKIIKNDYEWGDITVQKRERIKYE